VAVITFAIGVALTTIWVVPRFATEQHPPVAIAHPAQQQEIVVPPGWRQLDFNNNVLMMLPPDMRAVDLVADFLRYTEGYSNGSLHLTIIGDVQLAEFERKLRDKKIFTRAPPETSQNEPTYTESLIQVDGRQPKLAIAHTRDRGIAANLCFSNADDSAFDLLVSANCKDEQALATARQIFSSIRFKR
jgi:hypothetical protein